jgi:hypothetical protein
MASLFETAVRGYKLVDDVIKETRGYNAAREEFGEGPAAAPELYTTLRRDRRAEANEPRLDAQNQRAQQRFEMEQQEYQQSRDEDGLLKFVQGVRQGRDTGRDVGEVFDELAEVLPKIGVAEEDIPNLRAEVVENPQLLDTIYESLASDRMKIATGRMGARDGKSAQSQADTENALLKFDDTLARINQLKTENLSGGQAAFGLPGWGVFSGGFGALGTAPGSAAADYVASLDALQGDIRSQAYETLKGGGQITEAESKFAAEAYANLSRNTSWEKYQSELADLEAYMIRLRDAAIRRAGGEVVPSVTPPSEDPNYSAPETALTVYQGMIDTELNARYIGGPGSDPTDPANWQPLE